MRLFFLSYPYIREVLLLYPHYMLQDLHNIRMNLVVQVHLIYQVVLIILLHVILLMLMKYIEHVLRIILIILVVILQQHQVVL